MVKINYLLKPYFLSVVICCFFFYSGWFSFSSRNPYKSLVKKSELSEIKGIILSSPVKLSNQKYYSCKFNLLETKSVKGIKSMAGGIITVFIPAEMVEALFPGKIYSSAKKKGAFLYETGICVVLKGQVFHDNFYAYSAENPGFKENLSGKISKFRALCRLQFKRLMYSWKEGGGLLLALLSGAREYTETEITESFKNAGLSHILALSGMHLSLFSGIAVFFGDKIKKKKITFFIRLAAIILFVWFAGFSPSLLRAFICAILILISTIESHLPPDMFLILCFSFLIHCVISPSDIYNAGFIFSYGALAGILLFNNKIRNFTSKFMSNYFSNSISSSISAQSFTAPISLKLFGTFSPIGIIAAPIVSPLVTFFIYSGLGLIVLGLLIPGTAKASGIFVNLQYTIIKNLVLFFSKAPVWRIN